MRILIISCCLLIAGSLAAQTQTPSQPKIMTLGVFHFAYQNLDVVVTAKKDQVSVLEEPYQSEIAAIAKAIKEYQPTIIAIEQNPGSQPRIDSLYSLYQADKWSLEKNEIYQLGFRIGRDQGLSRIYCVNDMGRHYENLESLFKDSTRLSKFESYYLNSPAPNSKRNKTNAKVPGIISALLEGNDPASIRKGLATYLSHPFKYEEKPGDFTGVDFETGRWYNRNLRIFRNIQRIPHGPGDRILLIIGSEHLNLLNLFFDISTEFEFVSPLPYLTLAEREFKKR